MQANNYIKTLIDNHQKNGNLLSINDFVVLVNFFIDKKCYPKALQVVNSAIQIHYPTKKLVLKKIHLLLELNRIIEAKKLLKFYKQNFSTKSSFYLLEGIVNLKLNRIKKAVICFERVLFYSSSKKIENYKIYIAKTFLRSGVYDLAEHYLESLKNIENNPDVLLDFANTQMHRSKIKAIEYLNKYLFLRPEDKIQWLNLATVYYYTAQYEKAFQIVSSTFKIDKNFTEAYILLGKLNYKVGKFTAAFKNFNQASQIYKDYHSLELWKAKALIRCGYNKKASKILKKILKKDDQNSKAWFLLALLHQRKNNKKAIQDILNALAINKNSFIYWKTAANIFKKTKHTDFTKTAFENSLKLNPSYERTWFDYLNYLIEHNECSYAQIVMKIASNFVNDLLYLYTLMSFSCLNIGRIKSSLSYFRLAYQIDPQRTTELLERNVIKKHKNLLLSSIIK